MYCILLAFFIGLLWFWLVLLWFERKMVTQASVNCLLPEMDFEYKKGES